MPGDLPTQAVDIAPDDAEQEAAETAARSDNEEEEEFSDNDGSESQGGDTTDDDEGPPFACPEGYKLVEDAPSEDDKLRAATIVGGLDVGT